ncbi:MAG: type III pantothenate kinase [Flavobacteriaceae bacterium]|nr:type III pantothenate kinase [Bacteroidia bacterium]NNL17093.1 type III pantothenate kinase [Flavobacteriaceae bacterium]
MNLIIDVGNTNVKLAVFDKNYLVIKETIKPSRIISSVNKLLKKFPQIDKSVISSVGKVKASLLDKIRLKVQLLVLDANCKLPFKNLYKSPKTLGVDRIALVSSAVQNYSTRNVLIIDAGTCITYDFINNKNEYLGGAISPGIRQRYQSLNNLTANLPLLDTKLPEDITGTTTDESIHSGIIFGVLLEINGVVTKYSEEFKELTVILTGGDADFLSNQLKSTIFANSNFLLEGLNFILEYNLSK